MRRRTRIIAATTAGLAGALLATTPAGAHVGAAIEQQDGSTVTVAFTFHHGCDGEPTTGLRVQLPDGTTDVVAENPDGWTSTTSDGEIEWTGGSVPDGVDARFAATMSLTAVEGETVPFPTIQVCPNATNDWIQVSTGDIEPENPAPTVVMGTVGAAEEGDDHSTDDDHSSTGDDDHDDEASADEGATSDAAAEAADTDAGELGAEQPVTTTAAATSDSDDSSNTALIVAGIVVVALLIGGGVVVANRRKAAA